MTETDADIHDAFEEATTTAERVYDDADVDADGDDSLPDEQAETLRESTERLAAAVSEASLEELLDATGFENVPDEVSPVDLMSVIRDADPAAIVELRTLLQLADLGESWSDLSDEERTDRLNRVVGEDGDDEGGFAQLKEYLDQFGHLVGDEDAGDEGDGESETTAEEAEGDATASDADAEDGGDAGEADAEDEDLVQLEEHLGRLKQLVGDDSGAEADADAETAEADADAETTEADAGAETAEADAEATASDEAADAAEADAVAADEKTADEKAADDGTDDRRQSATGSSSRLSTVPSSRADMGKSTRYSSIRGRK